MEKVPEIKLLPEEKHRDTVLREADEKAYINVANGALADLFILLIDSAMRPEEAYRSQWEMVDWTRGIGGTIRVSHGKTVNARREHR